VKDDESAMPLNKTQEKVTLQHDHRLLKPDEDEKSATLSVLRIKNVAQFLFYSGLRKWMRAIKEATHMRRLFVLINIGIAEA